MKLSCCFLPILFALATGQAHASSLELPNWLKGHKGEITVYAVDSKHVYLISQFCCDIPTQVYSESGEKICSLGGGFANQIDEKCLELKKRWKFVQRLTSQNVKPKSVGFESAR